MGKHSNTDKDISGETKTIVLFGNDKYINDITKNVEDNYKISHIERFEDKIIVGRDPYSIYSIIKIIVR